MKTDDLISEIERLHVEDGDILLLKLNAEATAERLDGLRELLREALGADRRYLCIVLHPNESASQLTDEQLQEAGLRRITE